MSRHSRQASWLALWAFLAGFPFLVHAAEAPGGLTIVVTDQVTDRPLPAAQVTLTERKTGSTRSVETDGQGRAIVEPLDPGLYSVSVAKDGFASSHEPSVRVITRKNVQIGFELGEQAIQTMDGLVVRARQADTFASPSSIHLDREALRSAVGGARTRSSRWTACPDWPPPVSSRVSACAAGVRGTT